MCKHFFTLSGDTQYVTEVCAESTVVVHYCSANYRPDRLNYCQLKICWSKGQLNPLL